MVRKGRLVSDDGPVLGNGAWLIGIPGSIGVSDIRTDFSLHPAQFHLAFGPIPPGIGGDVIHGKQCKDNKVAWKNPAMPRNFVD